MEVPDDRVRGLQLALERDILDAVGRTLPYVTALMLAYATFEWQRGQLGRWLTIEVAVLVATSVGMSSRFSHRTRGAALTTGLTVAAGCALLHFGPRIGTGVLFVAAAISSTLLWEMRGSLLVLAGLSAAFVVAAVRAQPSGLEATLVWTRMGVATVLTLAYVVYVFRRVMQRTRRALEAEVESLNREEREAEERENILRSAEAAERLASLGRMARGVAHDFNNALQVIQMGVGVLRASKPDPRSEALLADVETAARNAAATVRELLTFSRQAPQPEGRCEPAALLRRLQRTLGRMLPQQVELRIAGEYEGSIEVAEGELEHVLIALVFNARDNLPEGGAIEVCYAEGADGGLSLSVTDDAPAMDDTTRARIFEPFFHKDGSQGTGLGLATVWGIVTRAAGTIEVQSRPPNGNTFDIWLPRCNPRSVRPLTT
ncbi:MAG: HAMP domain-containing sensor histidine kinase [Myxococcales bacterium]